MINVTGEIFIKKTEKGVYYTNTATKKLEDDKYDYAPILVGFKKGIELTSFTKIKITNGFLTHFKTQDDAVRNKIIVLDFEVISEGKDKAVADNGFAEVTDDDLPF